MDCREIPRGAYPKEGIGALREIPQPPERLWLRGTLPPSSYKKLAVVGSRALTAYGRDACQYLLGGLRGVPVSVVSGLALGADACAHEAALAAGLHTIAVPGSGLSDSYIAPRTNLGIAQDILAAGGALLSEHPPETGARPAYFPSRNRIMVGIADAVLVIEAGEKSGTLITARLASDYNRDLLCVPHRIGDAHGFAASIFIRLGAAYITEPRHILEALGLGAPAQQALPLLSEHEALLLTLLAVPRTRQDLITVSKLSDPEAEQALATLILKGLLKEEYGTISRT
ncbi:MAG TPA: DNA-processing protein DprA [Candidatus Paceibacterota bacterium]|nr:DNA-processing protein DprA [Candidatus Paceibacterota bacterium]